MAGESVFTTRVDGTGRVYLGQLGGVDGLVYSDSLPGGPAALSCTLQADPARRPEALNVGRRVCVLKGGSIQWEGSLTEPAPGDGSWSVAADGAGTWGGRFRATYTSPWGPGTADEVISGAISRGLRWVKGTVTGGLVTQPVESGASDVGEFLAGLTSPQSSTWRVQRVHAGLQVNLIPIPSVVTRLLITTQPVARTVAGYTNVLYTRYQSGIDSAGDTATFATVSAANAASIAAHDRLEDQWDLTSSGLLTAGAATTLAGNALGKYQAASYAGPFTVARGQYLSTGGVAVDLACEHAGEVAQLIMAGGPYGAELRAGPVIFPVGGVSYDSDNDQLAITPLQSYTGSLSDVLSLLTPKAPA